MAQARDREFADALRHAVDARGLSLERVRAHLLTYGHDVSVATLSYWQTGRSVPVRRSSLQALGALEAVLAVPRGALASKLPSQPGRQSGPRSTASLGISPAVQAAARITAELGIDFNDGYDVISQEQTVRIDGARGCSGAAVDTVIVATKDGLDRLLVGYRSDVPGVLIEVSAVSGCRIGRTAAVAAETLTVTEVLLDQPLRAGEPYRFRTRARYDTPAVLVRDWARLHFQPIRTSSLTLSFAPGDVPECWLYVGPHTIDPAYEPVRLARGELTVLREDFGPGVIAVRWAWPDDDVGLTQTIRPLPGGLG